MNKTINLLVDITAQAAGVAPLPYLQPAFTSFQMILQSIAQLRTNRHQLSALAQAAAQILLALNAQDPAYVDPATRVEFEHILSRIEAFCERMKRRRFVRAFLESSMDQNEIQLLQAQLTVCVDAFKIGAQVSMMDYARQVEEARQEDQAESNAALRVLLEKQDRLLDLIGDAPANEAGGGDAQRPETQQTVFSLLEGILASLKTADLSGGREEDYQEALARLRRITSPPQLDPNPILVLLRPGLKPDVLVDPLKWRMHKLMWIDNLSIHLTTEMCERFSVVDVGSRNFIDHLVNCEDRPLQYAALEVFMQDKDLKHFFKQDFVFTPSDNHNPILANLKPGVTPAALVPPLRYEIQKFAWIEILTQQLHSDQISSFFKAGPEGCERFIKYLTEGEADIALQYAALEVFRQDKRVGHYFIQEEMASKSEE